MRMVTVRSHFSVSDSLQGYKRNPLKGFKLESTKAALNPLNVQYSVHSPLIKGQYENKSQLCPTLLIFYQVFCQIV